MAQWFDKTNVAPAATDEEWKVFVDRYESGFADEVSELAQRYWAERDPITET